MALDKAEQGHRTKLAPDGREGRGTGDLDLEGTFQKSGRKKRKE
jgi:hypothetical protein